MIKVLEIGSAENPERGYKPEKGELVVRLDIKQAPHVKVIHNLEKTPYPFKSNTFDKIYASHVLEHLSDTMKVMEELHRICKKDGTIIILVPHFSGYTAWSNPDHKKAFAADSFYRLGQKFFVKNMKLHYIFDGEGKPALVKLFDKILNSLANANIKFCERIWCYWVGGFTEIYCELQVKK